MSPLVISLRRKSSKQIFKTVAKAAISNLESEQFIFLFISFYLQVSPTLLIKFRVNCPFRSCEEVLDKLSRWRLW